MSSAKKVTAIAVLAKAETTYNAGASMSLAGVDSVKLQAHPELTEEFVFDGARAAPPGSLGAQRRTSPSGPMLNTSIEVELKGNGSGYSTPADRIPNLHTLLEGAGYSGSLNAATWSFSQSPEADTPTSVGFEFYARGELHQVSGAYLDHNFTVEEGGPVVFEFPVQGTREAAVTDIARPTVNYEAETVIPPKATGIRVVFNYGGAFSGGIVKSIGFALGREITPRLDLNAATSHGGFNVGRRAPIFTVILEDVALATFDPYAILRAGTNGTFNFKLGTAGSNSFEWDLPQSQIVNVITLGDEGGTTATIELQIAPYVVDGEASDDLTMLAY